MFRLFIRSSASPIPSINNFITAHADSSVYLQCISGIQIGQILEPVCGFGSLKPEDIFLSGRRYLIGKLRERRPEPSLSAFECRVNLCFLYMSLLIHLSPFQIVSLRKMKNQWQQKAEWFIWEELKLLFLGIWLTAHICMCRLMDTSLLLTGQITPLSKKRFILERYKAMWYWVQKGDLSAVLLLLLLLSFSFFNHRIQ